MPPYSYPDLSWSGRVSRAMRTLQVVAIALTVGAVGGVVGAMALMELPGGSPHQSVRADAGKPRAAPSRSATRSATQVRSTPPAVAAAPRPDAQAAVPALAQSPKLPAQVAPAAAPPARPERSRMTAAPANRDTAKPETHAAAVAPAASALPGTRSGSAPHTARKPVEANALGAKTRGERRAATQTRAETPASAGAMAHPHEPMRAVAKSDPAKPLYDRVAPVGSGGNLGARSQSPPSATHSKLGSKRSNVPPPRRWRGGDDARWRDRDSSDWRYSRRDPDGYSDGDRGRWGGGFFGVFGGGDWRN